MSTPHIFIVDEISFPVHLEYQFAGTTPGRNVARHTGLLADIGRVRAGDPVLFYCLRRGFYGIFRILEQSPDVIWEPDSPGYLESDLGQHLIYRVFIEPERVYPKPVSEWHAIDNLPLYAKDVRWSLLYRKLKGERGCSYLFPQEYAGLVRLLNETNRGDILQINLGEGITFDSTNGIIVKSGKKKQPYAGTIRRPLNPLVEAAHLIRRGQQFESYLQAYFTLNINRDPALAEVCGIAPQLSWFANEVYAGAGMQRIDIFSILGVGEEQEFRVIELKTIPPSADDIDQIGRYIRWTKVYVPEATRRTIQPVLFSRAGLDKSALTQVTSAITAYDEQHEAKPIKYFEFDVSQDRLIIKQVK